MTDDINEQDQTDQSSDQVDAETNSASETNEQATSNSESADSPATATNTVRAKTAPGDTAALIAKSISGKDVNIDALLKVPVSLAIEVGRTQMSLSDLLDTHEGSVIELDRHLDEPLDILVNGALIAHGVVVLANEKFGLQITDIISLEERARSL